MKTSVSEKGQWARELSVEVPAERIESELNAAYRKYQKRIEVPGFRKGRVPLRVIKSRYGDSIRHEVILDLMPELVQEATKEAGLVAAAPPTISEFTPPEPGEDLRFTASLDIWPEIEVRGYEGLEVTRTVHTVTDEEVDEQLQEIRQRQATEQAVERPLQKGDVLLADLQRLDDANVPIIGDKFEERRFVMGEENAPSPEFEEALLGISAGEERNVRFAYRSDLPNENLAGTKDHFMVRAREVRERSLPELDDELAKDLGDQFQALGDLKAHIRKQLEERWEYLGRQRLRGEATERLMVANPFELPESLVDTYLENMRRAASERGGQDEETPEPSEDDRRYAERALRRYLLMEGLRKQLDVQVSDDEFDQFLASRAEELGVTVDGIKRSGRADEMRRELEEEKIYEQLLAMAKVTEETV